MDILILHGWGSNAARWQKVKELLESAALKVFVPDLPGFGQNPPPSRAWSVDDYVEWVKNYCDKENLSQFFLLGHSFGGRIAIKFSAKYSEKIEKLFLTASAGIKRKTVKKQFFKTISPFFRRFPLLQRFFYKFIMKSDYLLTSGIMRETYLKVIEEDLFSFLSKISSSTVIVWGDKDNITPLADAYLMKKKIINSQLEIIPDIGHRINIEAPEKLVELITQFATTVEKDVMR